MKSINLYGQEERFDIVKNVPMKDGKVNTIFYNEFLDQKMKAGEKVDWFAKMPKDEQRARILSEWKKLESVDPPSITGRK